MHKRFTILCAIVVIALSGLTCLGYHAVTKWAQGLEGARIGEFAEVAEQIREDVKHKLDEFMAAEQDRPYTDYLYYHVPDNVALAQQTLPLLPSPLREDLANGVAYGYFQLESDGRIVTPYLSQDGQPLLQSAALVEEANLYIESVRTNLLPVLNSKVNGGTLFAKDSEIQDQLTRLSFNRQLEEIPNEGLVEDEQQKGKSSRKRAFPIESLQNQTQEARIVRQQRAVATSNYENRFVLNEADAQQLHAMYDGEVAPPVQSPTQPAAPSQPGPQTRAATTAAGQPQPQMFRYSADADALERTRDELNERTARLQTAVTRRDQQSDQAVGLTRQEQTPDLHQVEPQVQTQLWMAPQPQVAMVNGSDTVQVRIEPFVPLVVPGEGQTESIFDGDVFLLRHVQIEDRHFVQGFQLDEETLVDEVEESARSLVREGMTFNLRRKQTSTDPAPANEQTAYTAILDFGFGELLLQLKELDPAWITKEIGILKTWYFSIIAVVSVAVALAMASLWHNLRAQIRLAERKDEFISAVSHELRTPLTSIRMYSEMLEKDWVKSKDKAAEYYRNMRQESERLSRLIENVLDFSRLQRNRKQYAFSVGSLDQCVAEVVEMMRPYAAEHGFGIETDLSQSEQTAFDRDAVVQIVVNLLDNAVKYARSASDKTITIRTRGENGYSLIEVEDHGPGIPHRQRRRVFEQFYRYGSETGGREGNTHTTGTGLGLALVKRFAEAHNGFVEVLSARPSGAIFRVGLAMQL